MGMGFYRISVAPMEILTIRRTEHSNLAIRECDNEEVRIKRTIYPSDTTVMQFVLNKSVGSTKIYTDSTSRVIRSHA